MNSGSVTAFVVTEPCLIDMEEYISLVKERAGTVKYGKKVLSIKR